jgi:hypothetical protein
MMIAAMPSVGQVNGAEPAVGASAVAGLGRNDRKRSQAQKVLNELLDLGVTPGYFGTVTLTVAFHDGSIQHITRQIEQMIRK